jgi:hypothetical protein
MMTIGAADTGVTLGAGAGAGVGLGAGAEVELGDGAGAGVGVGVKLGFDVELIPGLEAKLVGAFSSVLELDEL